MTGACNVCGGPLSTRFERAVDPQTGEGFSVAGCPRCELGQTTPQPEDLGRYYGAAYYGGRHGLTASLCARRRVRLVSRVLGAGNGRRLLDVGCGEGTFLLGARAAGWDVAGTEMNPASARAAGLRVEEQPSTLADLAPFTCITLWHSLEHVRDPSAMMRELVPLLSDDGALVVAVPNADGLQARLFGPDWLHLDVPRHLFHFGPRALTALLEGAGLRVVERWDRELEYDLLGWSQSALNRVMPSRNVFFSALTGRSGGVGRAEKAANMILGAVLTAAAVPFTYVASWARRGGTLVLAARRAPA